MARYKGHLVAAMVAGAAVSLALQSYIHAWTTVIIWLFWAVVGGLFPDIDIKSKGQKWFYLSLLPLYVFFLLRGWFVAMMIVSIGAILPLVVRHRGITHHWIFLLALPSLLACVLASYYPSLHEEIMFSLLFFCVGSLTHLWLDFGIKRMFDRPLR